MREREKKRAGKKGREEEKRCMISLLRRYFEVEAEGKGFSLPILVEMAGKTSRRKRKGGGRVHEYVNYATRISIVYLRNAYIYHYIPLRHILENTEKFHTQRMPHRHIVKRARPSFSLYCICIHMCACACKIPANFVHRAHTMSRVSDGFHYA